MSGAWDGQYDTFQGQSAGFYDPNSSQYNYGDVASAGNLQPGSNTYPSFMTPTDPYATLDQQGNYFQNDKIWVCPRQLNFKMAGNSYINLFL